VYNLLDFEGHVNQQSLSFFNAQFSLLAHGQLAFGFAEFLRFIPLYSAKPRAAVYFEFSSREKKARREETACSPRNKMSNRQIDSFVLVTTIILCMI